MMQRYLFLHLKKIHTLIYCIFIRLHAYIHLLKLMHNSYPAHTNQDEVNVKAIIKDMKEEIERI